MSDRLSHSCPTCGGDGVVPDKPATQVISTGAMYVGDGTEKPCPDCIDGYPREAVERAAKAGHDAYEAAAPDHGYETRPESRTAWEDLPENHRALMCHAYAAAIRAFLELDIICDGNCDHAVHQPEHIAIRAAELAGRVQTEEKP